MDFSPNKIESEHHLEVASTTPHFKLDASALRPYHITQGPWHIKLLHFFALRPWKLPVCFPEDSASSHST